MASEKLKEGIEAMLERGGEGRVPVKGAGRLERETW